MSAETRILLVDDEPGIVKMVTRRLESKGYVVLSAWDGEEAVQKAADGRPDLVVLDVMLPKMNGFDVCRALKTDARTSRIPVLMLSAMSQTRDHKTGLASGADAYLNKPFRSKDLLEKIEELLAGSKKTEKGGGSHESSI